MLTVERWTPINSAQSAWAKGRMSSSIRSRVLKIQLQQRASTGWTALQETVWKVWASRASL